MSRENVEAIRRAYAGTNTRDFSYLGDLLGDDVEINLPPEFPGTQTTYGPQGFLQVLAELEEAFANIHYEPQDVRAVADRVLAEVLFTGQARHTNLPLEMLVHWVYTFRDDKVVRMDIYLDRTTALEAVGLRE